MQWIDFANEFLRQESGQDLLEYALVLATVLAAVVFGSNSLAGALNTAFSNVNSRILGLFS